MANGFEVDGSQPNSPTPSTESGKPDIGSLFSDISPLDSNQVNAFNKSAHHLKELAQNKGFAINEAGFKVYTDLCNEFLDGYAEIKVELSTLTKKAALGDFPYANSVATFNVQVAADGKESLLPNLDLMRDGYLQAREAIAVARKNYNEADEENSRCLAKLSKELWT